MRRRRKKKKEKEKRTAAGGGSLLLAWKVAAASLPADARLAWVGVSETHPVPNWAVAGTAGTGRQLCPVSALLRIRPWLLLPVCSSPGLG